MRGAINYIEEELHTYPGYEQLWRKKLWRQVLQEKPQLQLCLAEPPVFGRKRKHPVSDVQLAEYIAGIYKTLSDHIHSN